MKQHIYAACTLAILSAMANAHDVWVISPTHLDANQTLQADLGYSHNYPFPEKIAANRLHIFKPMEVVSANGQVTPLVVHGENYEYASKKPLTAGTYRVVATYKPTFWVKDAQGKWSQNNLTAVPDAQHCEETQMFGKSVLHVGKGELDLATISRPVGQALEIVPLANPNTVEAGHLLPLQVLHNGKPLAGATITATADTVIRKDLEAMNAHREINGFSVVTDKNGRANFLPLIEGQWKVKVVHKTPYADQKVCQYSILYATLTVPVGDERVSDDVHKHHHHHH